VDHEIDPSEMLSSARMGSELNLAPALTTISPCHASFPDWEHLIYALLLVTAGPEKVPTLCSHLPPCH